MKTATKKAINIYIYIYIFFLGGGGGLGVILVLQFAHLKRLSSFIYDDFSET